jgi:hypothetical protein
MWLDLVKQLLADNCAVKYPLDYISFVNAFQWKSKKSRFQCANGIRPDHYSFPFFVSHRMSRVMQTAKMPAKTAAGIPSADPRKKEIKIP